MTRTFPRLTRLEWLAGTFAVLVTVFMATQSSIGDTSMEAGLLPHSHASSSSVSLLQTKLQQRKTALQQKQKTSQASAAAHARLSQRSLNHGSGAHISNHNDRAGVYVPPAVTGKKIGCGDGLIIDPEKCDDGNSVGGDGCSASCQVESGWQCTTSQPSTCWSRCGDGVIAAGKEECDDGNATPGDGCNEYCQREPGYTCSGTPSKCVPIPNSSSSS